MRDLVVEVLDILSGAVDGAAGTYWSTLVNMAQRRLLAELCPAVGHVASELVGRVGADRRPQPLQHSLKVGLKFANQLEDKLELFISRKSFNYTDSSFHTPYTSSYSANAMLRAPLINILPRGYPKIFGLAVCTSNQFSTVHDIALIT